MMRPPEQKRPGRTGASIWAVAAPNRKPQYLNLPKGARKAAYPNPPEAGRRWRP